DAGVIRFLLTRITDRFDAIVPCWDGDVEPLHAVYTVRCRPLMEASLRAGRYALRDFLARLRVDWVSEAELRRVRPPARILTNLNTPEELAAIGGRLDELEPRARGPAASPSTPATTPARPPGPPPRP